MKLRTTLFGLMVATTASAKAEFQSGGSVGEFKGYEMTNRLLVGRLLDPDDQSNRTFELARFFGEAYPRPGGLSSLLGTFSGDGNGNAYRNGTPNGVNMLLWYIGMSHLSRIIGGVCDGQGPILHESGPTSLQFQLAAGVYQNLVSLCAAGGDVEARAHALSDLWLNVVSFDAPEEEYDAFVAFFSSDPELLTLPPQVQIADAMAAMLLNPAVLLER